MRTNNFHRIRPSSNCLSLALTLTAILCGTFEPKNASAMGGGGMEGGGGFTINCAQTPVEPGRIETLDLYEGSQIPEFVMAKASGNLAEDYFLGVKNTYALQGYPDLAEGRREEILESLKAFFRHTQFVDSESQLPKANDLGNLPSIPPTCRVQQIAFYADTLQRIYILKPLWDQLDSLSQAALVQHELFYMLPRSVVV